jgi:polysaccharide deacetylase 2 family uncharacterized protein YibQ
MAKKKSTTTRSKPKAEGQKQKASRKQKSTTSKKSNVKRRRKSKKNQKKSLLWLYILLGMALLVGVGYFWGVQSTKQAYPIQQINNDDEILQELQSNRKKKPKAESKKLKAQSQKPKANSKPKVKSQKPKARNKPKATPEHSPKKQKQTGEAKAALPKEQKPKTTSKRHTLNAERSSKNQKAKLVIIIDDIHTKSELSQIKSLPFSVTPSIFPPYRLAHDTPKLAKNLKHYMVHLPMESSSAKFNRQYKTILISWNQRQIDDRIKNIRKMFPNARYINNHTGSVLTSNYHSMDMVYSALNKYGFIFIDSYTTSKSIVKKVSSKYHKRYLKRDIFIDNVQNVAYIKKQIKKGIKKAKKRGYSIIIGHPHKATLKALKESKSLLKQIDVVYIDELYKK